MKIMFAVQYAGSCGSLYVHYIIDLRQCLGIRSDYSEEDTKIKYFCKLSPCRTNIGEEIKEEE